MSLYLVAYHYTKPANLRVKTQKSGWMNNKNNVQIDEQVVFTKQLRTKDLSSASVIMDLVAKKVLRNRNSDKNYDQLCEYYRSAYPEYTNDLV